MLSRTYHTYPHCLFISPIMFYLLVTIRYNLSINLNSIARPMNCMCTYTLSASGQLCYTFLTMPYMVSETSHPISLQFNHYLTLGPYIATRTRTLIIWATRKYSIYCIMHLADTRTILFGSYDFLSIFLVTETYSWEHSDSYALSDCTQLFIWQILYVL